MTEAALHRTPRPRDIVLEQIRVVGLSLRKDAAVAAVVLCAVTLVIAIDIARGDAASWFDSDEWVAIGYAAFLFPFAVWRGERRFGPAFLWTLPVDRRRLAITRVFAGWCWLMIAVAVYVAWQLALAAASGVANAETLSPFAVAGATATYLLGSALVLGLRHPLRLLLATVAALFLLGMLDQAIGRGPYGMDTLMRGSGISAAVERAATSWLALPPFAQWALGAFLSIGAGLAALWAAASRHGERRRS
jgi:hypothetical protein